MVAALQVRHARWECGLLSACCKTSTSPSERVAMSRKETTSGRSNIEAMRMAPLTVSLEIDYVLAEGDVPHGEGVVEPLALDHGVSDDAHDREREEIQQGAEASWNEHPHGAQRRVWLTRRTSDPTRS